MNITDEVTDTMSAVADDRYTPSGRGPVSFDLYLPACERLVNRFSNFKGRAGLAEFWWVTATTTLFSIVETIFNALTDAISAANPFVTTGLLLIEIILSVFLVIASTALLARRLHDVRKSGWNQLWILTFIGIFYVLYLCLKPGDRGSNKWGDPDPLTAQKTISDLRSS